MRIIGVSEFSIPIALVKEGLMWKIDPNETEKQLLKHTMRYTAH